MLFSWATGLEGTRRAMDSSESRVPMMNSKTIYITRFDRERLEWLLERPPAEDLIGYLDLMDSHYRSFSRGIVKVSSIVYFAAVTYVALLAATSVLAARRWRG